jgi:phage tail sheath protein FI
MPEYLAPGVYVEEVSFRSKSIEGVPTSTTGFAGMTRYGPVRYTNGPSASEPRLVTSFTEFEHLYGGLERLRLDDDPERIPYLAHAARAFFLNGGKRLYVSRVYTPPAGGGDGVASLDFAAGMATWRARWPGRYGEVFVDARPVRSGNVALVVDGEVRAQRARTGTVVEVYAPGETLPTRDTPIDPARLRAVRVRDDGTHAFMVTGGDEPALLLDAVVLILEVNVAVVSGDERSDFYPELAFHPDQKRFIGRILDRDDPADEASVIYLRWDHGTLAGDVDGRLQAALDLATAMATGAGRSGRLTGGSDGALISPDDLMGEEAHPDFADQTATGLHALGEVEDIAIVAAPDAATLSDPFVASGHLVTHAELLRYRIAVVDGPPTASMSQIRAYRGGFDSKYAALYHPWIEVLDPLERPAQGAPPRKLMLPPSGFVCGIYARTDIERGVHKAPANEVVRGLTRFEVNINHARQEVLNPEGINALRFFEGRGNRVWGARTMSSDPEWKYVNVRRLFIYLENSIDRATQWAVFEPNNERLWAKVRRTIEDFLLVQWRNGALLGEKPEKAYFVRCDRTTMTQNDLDNGRLIALIGVAPVKPAEFVIFRIGQWTGDAVTNPTS